jgi:hypothetical protein
MTLSSRMYNQSPATPNFGVLLNWVFERGTGLDLGLGLKGWAITVQNECTVMPYCSLPSQGLPYPVIVVDINAL